MSTRRTLAALGWGAGWTAGWLLGWRLPPLRPASPGRHRDAVLPLAVVVPARDEEHTLGALLDSLAAQTVPPSEIVVVDDGSADGTAAVAEARSVRVVPAGPLPSGWAGKPWACAVGTASTSAPVLLFLDSDVRLGPDGLLALVEERSRRGGLVSVLPEHRTERAYEELSAPFNLVSVMGTGAAVPGADGRTDMAFGPCVAVARTDLDAVGGFESVAGELVEDIALARRFSAAGLPVHAAGGGSLVWFRMYGEGFGQLCEGWTKNMALGAASLSPSRRALIGLWVTSAIAPLLTVLVRRGGRNPRALLAVGASSVQLSILARRIGPFRWRLVVTQPIAMVVFCVLVARSAWHRRQGRTRWRGRTVAL